MKNKFLFKILLLGPGAVGKTSLLYRYVKNVTVLVPNFYDLSHEDQIKIEEQLYKRQIRWSHGWMKGEYDDIISRRNA